MKVRRTGRTLAIEDVCQHKTEVNSRGIEKNCSQKKVDQQRKSRKS